MAAEIGVIGLGKMGYRMAERLLEHNYRVVATDIEPSLVEKIARSGVISASGTKDVAEKLQPERIILISLPAGKTIDREIKKVLPYLSENDIILESGNSFYRDSQRRAEKLKEKGVYLLDVGVSGGISGARDGACLMVGGDRAAFRRAEPVFAALSRNNSYCYLGGSGSGHLVKGYHNFVEYGYLEALAEGLSSIVAVSGKDNLNIRLEDVCRIWSNGSIVESRLTRDAEDALKKNPNLEGISGSVYGQTQEEMEKLIRLAEKAEVKVPSCKSAVKARLESRTNPTFAGRIINAIRNVFGGHQEWKA